MNYYEKFLLHSERAKATHDLATLGIQALPILESLFDGSAKNEFGIPYNKTVAIGCGYITVRNLGKVAKPLEHFILEGIQNDHPYAVEAVSRFQVVEEETLIALAEALVRKPFGEAAYSLVALNQHKNSKVLNIVQNSNKAHDAIKRAELVFSKSNSTRL